MKESLKLKPKDKVAFRVDGSDVKVVPLDSGLEVHLWRFLPWSVGYR